MLKLKNTCVSFRHYGVKDAASSKDFFIGGAKIAQNGDIYEFTADISCQRSPYDWAKVLKAENSVTVDAEISSEISGVLSRAQFNPFWSRPYFEKDLSKIPGCVQNMLLKVDGGYLAVLPLPGREFYVCLAPSDGKSTLRFVLSAFYDGANEIKGTFALAAYDKDYKNAIKKAYAHAIENGYINSPLREKKRAPEFLKGFGWCTWNAFYHDVTENGIIQKMEEFKAKNVPVSYVIIDDGWSSISKNDEFKITSFCEDKEKFPNSLKGCIKRLKSEYGVKFVGVWHSLTAYWFGVEEGSELFYDMGENLTKTNTGYHIPRGKSAFDFFDKWYEYLKTQGVDFVKIDCQGNSFELAKGMRDCLENSVDLQISADTAAAKHFGTNVINCMGMNNINAHFRPHTALSRSSDDFFPDKPNSFGEHIVQNVYNSMFLDSLFLSDYDMWWTNHPTAKQNAVLRAVSASPVYVSDKVGETDEAQIKPFMGENGTLATCNGVLEIAPECVFENPMGTVLKVKNTAGSTPVIAVFNLSDKKKTVTINKSDFASENRKAVCKYSDKIFTGETFVLNLEANDAEIVEFREM